MHVISTAFIPVVQYAPGSDILFGIRPLFQEMLRIDKVVKHREEEYEVLDRVD